MWEPYVQFTRAHLPEADSKTVLDKFHVVSTSTRPSTRCGAASTGSSSATALTDSRGSKYLWLRRPADLTAAQRLVLRALQRRTSRSGAPGRSKSASDTFWDYRYPGAAPDLLHPLVQASDPQPAQADGDRRHADSAASAEPAHLPAPCLTNAGFEALNAVIQGDQEDDPRVPQR